MMIGRMRSPRSKWWLPAGLSLAAHGLLLAAAFQAPPRAAAPEPLDPVTITIIAPPPPGPGEKPVAAGAVVPPTERAARTRGSPRRAPSIDRDAQRGRPSIDDAGRVTAGGEAERRNLATIDLSPRIGPSTFDHAETAPKVDREIERKPIVAESFVHEDSAFTARVAADGSVEMAPNRLIDPRGITTVKVDFTDVLLSAGGDDPYAYEKRKFLDATREERLVMARIACGERLAASLGELPRKLDRIWSSDRTLSEKKNILFDLWDECAEDGPAEVLRHSELARATVVEFIHRNLPERSGAAYSPAELASLNRRRLSKRRFDPYDRSAL
jgi:hypothetical protein